MSGLSKHFSTTQIEDASDRKALSFLWTKLTVLPALIFLLSLIDFVSPEPGFASQSTILLGPIIKGALFFAVLMWAAAATALRGRKHWVSLGLVSGLLLSSAVWLCAYLAMERWHWGQGVSMTAASAVCLLVCVALVYAAPLYGPAH